MKKRNKVDAVCRSAMRRGTFLDTTTGAALVRLRAAVRASGPIRRADVRRLLAMVLPARTRQ